MATTGEDDVAAYIAGFPSEVRERLTRLQEVLLEHMPGGWQTVRYGMPAVMVGDRYGLHFAGWKKHVALYPVPVLDEPLEARVAPYRSGKDAVRFLHTRELPYDLVGEICDEIVRRR
jgi:uncharacterized protein YdhG (YjbR/CyaY superfamily)